MKIGDKVTFQDFAEEIRSGVVVSVSGDLYTVAPDRAEHAHAAGEHPRKRLAVCRASKLIRLVEDK
jgi:hypothetical protein